LGEALLCLFLVLFQIIFYQNKLTFSKIIFTYSNIFMGVIVYVFFKRKIGIIIEFPRKK